MVDIAELLSVVGAGVYAGVMVTIGVALGPWWLTMEPRAYATWFRDNFVRLATALSVGLVPAVIGTGLSLADADDDMRGAWWTVVAWLGVGILLTVAYHLPANFRIWSLELDDDRIRTELRRWLALHAVRVATGLGATVAALQAAAG